MTQDPYPQFLKTNGNLHIRGALIMPTAELTEQVPVSYSALVVSLLDLTPQAAANGVSVKGQNIMLRLIYHQTKLNVNSSYFINTV